jgi:hypothetical protein
MLVPTPPLTSAEVRDKANECCGLSRRATLPEHKVMLEHMAVTFERIATTLERRG